MSIVYHRKSRRQFLVGAGNTLLALPFLPSLFGSDALAAAAENVSPKIMMFVSEHNMLSDYWIAKSAATSAIGTLGTKEKLLSSLNALSDISPMLTNPIFDSLRLNNQMTIVRGLDFQAGVGHENFSALGGSNNECPTFDTLMEDSAYVYPIDTPANMTKAIRVDFDPGWLSTRKVGAEYQRLVAYGFDGNNYYNGQKFYTLPVMYANVFGSLTNGSVGAADMTNKLKSNILNRVFQSYTTFKSNRKISSQDIATVDQHMGFLADLQRTLNSTPPPPICQKPNDPGSSLSAMVYTPLYIDLLSVAFKCGLTKIGAFKFEGQNPQWLPGLSLPDGTDVHGAIHGGNTQDLWTLKRHAHTTFDKHNYNLCIGRFLQNLDQIEGTTGRTYGDNMITTVLPKFGMETADGGSGHGGYDTQAMIFGSMGGKMRSGRYLVYPDINDKRMPMNALFVNFLEMMGIPVSEYSRYSTVAGKGWGRYGDPGIYGQNFYAKLSELLP